MLKTVFRVLYRKVGGGIKKVDPKFFEKIFKFYGGYICH
nr:MAG TPA: hypothetical protein [Caudoviricetes sp.]